MFGAWDWASMIDEESPRFTGSNSRLIRTWRVSQADYEALTSKYWMAPDRGLQEFLQGVQAFLLTMQDQTPGFFVSSNTSYSLKHFER